MAKFNEKTFNPEAFGKYVERIPKTKRNELIKSRARTDQTGVQLPDRYILCNAANEGTTGRSTAQL